MGLSSKRVKRLKNKLRQSRARLLKDYPFFALLLMYLKFVAVADMKKLSTDGRSVYFNPDFIDKLYDNELDFVLCHQVMHIIMGHIQRLPEYAGDDYHFACDIIVNRALADIGWEFNRFSHLGDVYYFVPGNTDIDFSYSTPEKVCTYIPFSLNSLEERTRNRFMFDNDSQWDNEDDCGFEGVLILDISEKEGRIKICDGGDGQSDGQGDGNSGDDGETHDTKNTKADWQGRAAAAAKLLSDDAENTGTGCVPDFIKRMFSGKKKSAVDWRKILDNFIQECICDYSFLPPDRRFSDSDFFLPDFNEKDFTVKEILFMVDTSSSVDDAALGAVYSEICAAVEQFGGKLQGRLGFFDADVKPPLPFETVEDIIHIIPYGGGGTDFRPVFSYVRSKYVGQPPACIVIFTDGDGPYPDESETMGIPVLWLIDNSCFTPPFGKVTRVLAGNETM